MITPSVVAPEEELQEVQHLLNSPARGMKFSPALAENFMRHMQSRAIETLSHGWPALLLLYVVIGISTYAEARLLSAPAFLAGNLRVWWSVYFCEGVVILGFVRLPYFPKLHQRYHLYVGLLSALALCSITVATSAFPDPYFNHHSSYVVIFILCILYCVGLMQLKQAVITCVSASVLSAVIIAGFGLWLDWGLYLQYVALANVVGILLCFMLNHRDRIMFLQARQLELERNKLDKFSRELDRLSREDVLTSLANRRHFNEMFQVEWDRARREKRVLSLLFVDVDYFKPFNDSLGHLEGDRVLASVGVALKGVLRRPGDMAARYGGEEFVLLLPGTPLAGALEVAVQVRQVIEALNIPHPASSVASCVTVSVGVAAMQPSGEMRAPQLIDAADEAVYAAKAAGRNCIMKSEAGGFIKVAS